MKYQEIRAELGKRKANTTNRIIDVLREMFPDCAVSKDGNDAFSVRVSYKGYPMFKVKGNKTYGGTRYLIMSDSCKTWYTDHYRVAHCIEDADADRLRCERRYADEVADRACPFGYDPDDGESRRTHTFLDMQYKLLMRSIAKRELEKDGLPYELRSYLKDLADMVDDPDKKDRLLSELPLIEGKAKELIDRNHRGLEKRLEMAEEDVREYLEKRKARRIF